jgi:hypothetical protein
MIKNILRFGIMISCEGDEWQKKILNKEHLIWHARSPQNIPSSYQDSICGPNFVAACLEVASVLEAKAAALDGDPLSNDALVGEVR